VVAALRELADALEEASETPTAAESRPQPRKGRPRRLTRPEGEATPIISAQAARILREKGFT
jgi:hypothetical protein